MFTFKAGFESIQFLGFGTNSVPEEKQITYQFGLKNQITFLTL